MEELIDAANTQSVPVYVQMPLPENFGLFLTLMIFALFVLIMAEVTHVIVAFVQLKQAKFESDSISDAIEQQHEELIGDSIACERKRSDYLEKISSLQQGDELEEPITIYQDIGDEALKKQIELVIQENMSDPRFTVLSISKQLCMDRTGLFRKVQDLYSLSPSDLLKVRRIERIKAILDNDPDISSAKLSSVSGIKSKVIMERMFLLQIGVNIAQYRSLVKRGK